MRRWRNGERAIPAPVLTLVELWVHLDELRRAGPTKQGIAALLPKAD